MPEAAWFFIRAARAGVSDVNFRVPELSPLRDSTIALFGLGCLGAPSALEFARAGVGTLRILDHDYVDPGTMARWPFGLAAAGLPKTAAIAEFIRSHYPRTLVQEYAHRIGAPRFTPTDARPELEVLEEMTRNATLIYDATAEIGVQQCLADLASQLRIPYISVDATHGAWGGKIVRIRPQHTEGCWLCLRYAMEEGSLVPPPDNPNGELQPLGCADPTFTGAGFDLQQIALAAVRMAVSTICQSTLDGYPAIAADVQMVHLRGPDGSAIAPQFIDYHLPRHNQCPRCNA
jgi:molybdopterin/thiamine biosynthesis adenylyltransferase